MSWLRNSEMVAALRMVRIHSSHALDMSLLIILQDLWLQG